MKTYIALLRGINVGGHKKVPMAELREILTKSGLENVQTYIQSGNVVFKSSQKDAIAIESCMEKTIRDYFDFEVPVMIRTREALKTIFDGCPFPEEKKINSYFSILSEVPTEDAVNEAIQKTYPNEVYVIDKDCIYLFCANGYGKAKFNLNFFEQKLKVSATARNYKTMVKLLSLSDI